MQTKTCVKCGVESPVGEFYVARGNSDGLSSWCKSCAKGYGDERRAYWESSSEPVPESLVCSKCGENKPFEAFARSKTGRYGKRRICKQCSGAEKFASRRLARGNLPETKVCADCGQTLPSIEFRLSSTADGLETVCMSCVGKPRDNKALTDAFKVERGCVICGYREHACSLDFHHIDPSTKEFTIATKLWSSKARIEQEMSKCVVLCANCHRALHAGVISLSEECAG